jgi:hypothetical protein
MPEETKKELPESEPVRTCETMHKHCPGHRCLLKWLIAGLVLVAVFVLGVMVGMCANHGHDRYERGHRSAGFEKHYGNQHDTVMLRGGNGMYMNVSCPEMGVFHGRAM